MAPGLKHISIRYQFMAWVGLVVAVSILATGWVIHMVVKDRIEKGIVNHLATSSQAVQKMVSTSLTAAIRSHLKGIAQGNVAMLGKLYQDSLDKRIDPARARQMGAEILLSQTIGKTGYVSAVNSAGQVVVHPKVQGRDMSGHWVVKAQIKQKSGYLEYDWQNPSDARARAKVLYMAYFEPWDLIVSVSSYRDEFISLFNLEELRADILSMAMAGEKGTVFITDRKGNLLAQSRDTMALPGEGQLLKEIVAAMGGQPAGRLTWPVPDPKTGRPGEIKVFYRFIEDLGWYVGSFIYLDEIHAYLDHIRGLILASTGVILVLILPVSFFLSHRTTRPMTRLAREMASAGVDNFEIRADDRGPGEVGLLARQFNTYMDRLKAANDKLREEIRERVRAEGQLVLFAEVFENALEGISITNAKGEIIAINRAFTDITGYTLEDVAGRNPSVLKSDRHDEAFYEKMWQGIASDGCWTGEIWNRRKTGEAYPEILSISAIRNADGNVTHYVAVFHDISEMKSQQEEIRHQAYHDALTGLPNRYLAQDRLVMALRHARRQKDRVAVFFLDMDNFKYVNDSLGHAMGDKLLQEFSQRLSGLVREQDTVSRLGGDEFLIIASDIRSDRQVVELAERLLSGMNAPFQVEDHEIIVTFSLGITNFPADGGDAPTLIKNADVAMYQSKSKGKNKYSIFTPELSAFASLRMDLVRAFREALGQRDFTVYYQPKVNPCSGGVTGFEALVRWQKPDSTIVSPGDFIPLAEETGLILPLGRQVLEDACRAARAFNQVLDTPVRMAVNLSPLQFEQPDIVADVMEILDQSGLSPDLLELEITETTMMTDLDASVHRLDTFQEKGVSIAVDDFGTGYSSLYYLKTFPISTLKIDRSFIRDITVDQSDAKIVETIILMAGNLGLSVVAEGVETGAQMEILRQYGCHEIQGYYYARPMAYDQTLAYLADMNRKKF